jgi:hypothetical protein
MRETYYNTGDLIFVQKKRYNMKNNRLVEGWDDKKDIVPGFPVNKKLKFNEGLMVKAIQNGMVLLINYAGDKDEWKGGRERVIYPMVIGVNRNTGNMLVRGWHLNGWSVHEKRNTEKVWRLFKTVNIKDMMFTGDFYRLPPVGYRLNDRAMTERIIAQADFNIIRKNQQALLNEGKIELEEESKTSADTSKVVKIDIRPTDTKLDLTDPWANTNLNKSKIDDTRITIMKTIMGNEWLAILGAVGTEGRITKVFDGTKLIGTYKVIRAIIGKELLNTKSVRAPGFEEHVFDLYFFVNVKK